MISTTLASSTNYAAPISKSGGLSGFNLADLSAEVKEVIKHLTQTPQGLGLFANLIGLQEPKSLRGHVAVTGRLAEPEQQLLVKLLQLDFAKSATSTVCLSAASASWSWWGLAPS